ncbi:MAG: threonine/serine exporter family protein [Gemmatimonadaceae bacterium]
MTVPSLSLTSVYEAPPRPEPATDEGAARFLALAARAYAAVDEVPARIEEGVMELAERLGFRADCSATATAIFLSLSKGDRQWTEVIRLRLAGPDYTRAVALHRILARVMRGDITADDAAERLTALLAWRPPSRAVLWVLASALLSASAGLLLRAERTELLLAVALGALVGGVLRWIGGRDHLAPLAPVLLATIASAVAFGVDRLGVRDVRPMPLLVASLVILLPGWRLTVAMTELAQGHWTSGSGRFLAAITTLLLLIVGVVVGLQGVESTEHATLVMPSLTNLPAWVRVLSPLAAGVAMTELFHARRRDAVWIVVICIVTSFAAYAAGRGLGSTASAFCGAFTAMAVGTLLARWLKLPYLVLQQPATVLLVPGSIGFMSMGSLVSRNVTVAVQTGFQMLFVALTLAIGAMAAQVALRPITARIFDDA